MSNWIQALVFIGVAAVVSATMLVGAWLLRVVSRRRTPLTGGIYECGEEPEGPAWLKFRPQYYLVALVFVLFDLEAAFLFAWALVLPELGFLAVIDMFLFVGILLLGWLYALRKGALRWQ